MIRRIPLHLPHLHPPGPRILHHMRRDTLPPFTGRIRPSRASTPLPHFRRLFSDACTRAPRPTAVKLTSPHPATSLSSLLSPRPPTSKTRARATTHSMVESESEPKRRRLHLPPPPSAPPADAASHLGHNGATSCALPQLTTDTTSHLPPNLSAYAVRHNPAYIDIPASQIRGTAVRVPSLAPFPSPSPLPSASHSPSPSPSARTTPVTLMWHGAGAPRDLINGGPLAAYYPGSSVTTRVARWPLAPLIPLAPAGVAGVGASSPYTISSSSAPSPEAGSTKPDSGSTPARATQPSPTSPAANHTSKSNAKPKPKPQPNSKGTPHLALRQRTATSSFGAHSILEFCIPVARGVHVLVSVDAFDSVYQSGVQVRTRTLCNEKVPAGEEGLGALLQAAGEEWEGIEGREGRDVGIQTCSVLRPRPGPSESCSSFTEESLPHIGSENKISHVEKTQEAQLPPNEREPQGSAKRHNAHIPAWTLDPARHFASHDLAFARTGLERKRKRPEAGESRDSRHWLHSSRLSSGNAHTPNLDLQTLGKRKRSAVVAVA